MSTATKTMGLKRICTGCGERFYDLNKRPITCPSCKVEFTGEIKVKRRGRIAAAEVKKDDPIKVEAANKNEDEIVEAEAEEEDHGVEVVSLDDAAKTEDKDKNIVEEDTLDDIPDLGGDLDNDLGDDDDTLLEEEES